jgi:hypothetical protein
MPCGEVNMAADNQGIYKALTGNIYAYLGHNAAAKEAASSGLPGYTNGPGDTYRHILGAAELRRRFGYGAALVILEANELKGDVRGQASDEYRMDRRNNEIGLKIGEEAETVDDVVRMAREAIEQAYRQGGSGAGDTAMWLPISRWHGDLHDPDGMVEWKPYRGDPEYPYGGVEHRFENALERALPKFGPRAEIVDDWERSSRVELLDDGGPISTEVAYMHGNLYSGSPPYPSKLTRGRFLFDNRGNFRPLAGGGGW